MSDSYTLAALRGLGMDGDDSYTSAALRGFGDESYTSAALRGCGCDCDERSYTGAALRGMGKFKKGSPEAKAFMARLRAMRGTKSKGGKKLKGGIAFSTIAPFLGLIPAAIKGAHAIYKWIKGSGMLKSKKGGRALILDSAKRDEFIETLKHNPNGRSRAAMWPYKLDKARIHADKRIKRLGTDVVNYLKDHNLLDAAIFDTESMKHYKKQAYDALDRPAREAAAAARAAAAAAAAAAPPTASKGRRRKNPRPPAKQYSLRSLGLNPDDIPE